MILDRLARIQLTIFAIVTVLCVGAIAVFYLHVPARLGIGAYNITADFASGGGLYKNANVTYRGVTVGRVEAVTLTNDSVEAHMRLNTKYQDSRKRHGHRQERLRGGRAVRGPGTAGQAVERCAA